MVHATADGLPPEVLDVDGGEVALVGEVDLVPENNSVREFPEAIPNQSLVKVDAPSTLARRTENPTVLLENWSMTTILVQLSFSVADLTRDTSAGLPMARVPAN